MAKYRFEQIAINSTEKKKPVEEDRFTYLGLEHLDSGIRIVYDADSQPNHYGIGLVRRIRNSPSPTLTSTLSLIVKPASSSHLPLRIIAGVSWYLYPDCP